MMTKPYFAKYLPVEGEIKEGDMYWFNGSSTDLRKDKNDAHGTCSCVKVKLFLCSRDIQVGDRFLRQYEGSSGNTPEMECIDIDQTMIYSRGINDDIYNHKELCFKIIGEISPEAIWVKEGDEFDKDEIRREVLKTDPFGEGEWYTKSLDHVCGKLGETNEHGWKTIKDVIKTKCSQCKKFH